MTLQLVRAADGVSTWGTKVEGDAEDLFALQDEVARHVAAAPPPARRQPRRRRPRAGAAPAGDAYDLYLQGRARLLRDNALDYVAAINCFERARDADPSFALGWAGLADAYARMAFNFQPEGDWHRRAAGGVRRGVAARSDRCPKGSTRAGACAGRRSRAGTTAAPSATSMPPSRPCPASPMHTRGSAPSSTTSG